MNKLHPVVFAVSLCTIALPASSDSLLVGYNTLTPLQVYSTAGTYQQDFGPTGASAGVEEGSLLYIIQPNTTTFTSSLVTAYDDNQHAVSSFTIPDAIADGAPGSNGSLWLAGYDGIVYQYSTAGKELSSFNTGYTSIGIASNGSSLYTTEGDTSDGIDVRNSTGKVLSTVYTGYYSLYGLAFDSANSTFYAGSFDSVYRFSSSGSLMNTLFLPGNARTPNGAIHDGLELVDLSALGPVTVPEPGSRALLVLGFCALLLTFRRRILRSLRLAAALTSIFFLGAFAPTGAYGAVSVSLTSPTSTIPVGSTLEFTARASDSTNGAAKFTYQFNVRASGASAFSLVQDYYRFNTVEWTPSEHEGSYEVQVVAKSSTGASGSATSTVDVTSRVSGSAPVISTTRNPLVALYSAPPCSAPKQVRVLFKSAPDPQWQMTPMKPCNGLSVNFYIGGMRASTAYTLHQELYNGPFATAGPSLTFVTGSIPAGTNIPSHFRLAGPTPPTSTSYPLELRATLLGHQAFATDLNENVVWYLTAYQPGDTGYLFHLVSGGTFLVTMDDRSASRAVCPSGACGDHQFFQEYDMAGNPIRETNWTILNQEINTLRMSQRKPTVRLDFFSHEGIRLPNGDTVTLVTNEQVKNQGSGPVDVLGDTVVVLNTNFQPVWTWDAFDHLPITRKSVLVSSPTCTAATPGCPANFFNLQPNHQPYTQANDWTHANSIYYDPRDGNLVVSIRNQGWVVKIAYENGSGDGHIIWTLGYQGSFTLASGYPISDWFSGQHYVGFLSNGLLGLFDNNNASTATGMPDGTAHGQAWSLDLSHMIATPVVNHDLGVSSLAVGSTQLLSNGNYDFQAGFVPGLEAQSFELTPSGALVWKNQTDSYSYRGLRLRDMYTP